MSDTSRSGGEGAVGEGPVADARGLADMSSDVLIVVAPDLTVRRASSAAAGVLGRDPAEMAGASAPVLVREEDRELLETLLRAEDPAVAVGERPLLARAPSGVAAWIDVRRRRVVGERGDLVEIHLAAANVSEQVEHEREREALSGVTDELSAMVEMADEAAREQAALAEIARLVAREDAGRAEIMNLIADRAGALTSAASATVARLDDDGLATLLGRSGIAARSRVARLDPSGTPVAEAAEAGSAVISGPYRANGFLDDGVPGWLQYPSGVAAPVVVRGEVWGAIAASGVDVGAPERMLERIARFAELAAVAISSTEAREQLLRQATTDPLTGLANHRTFQETLTRAWADAREDDTQLSLAIVDIDHFKRVNDTFGHGAGDEALRVVAERLRGVCHDRTEVLARTGGEESAWLMPGRAEHEALALAEAGRRAVSAAPIRGVGRVTVSIGVCEMRLATAPEELLERADRAFYRAKEGGRDRVLAFRPGVATGTDESVQRAVREQAMGALRALAAVVDAKDHDTHLHSERTADLSDGIARALGWDPPSLERLMSAAYLHDLGKIGIPDAILLKPAALDEAEWRVIRTHPQLGALIAGEVLDEEQAGWIRNHHEHWDGSGYPSGLAGEDIPEGARIISIASAWDAMTRPRRYGGELTRSEALEELWRARGRRFWPAATGVLLDAIDELDPVEEPAVVEDRA